MYNIYRACYSQFNMLWRNITLQCEMHTLYDCFANVCRFLCAICVVLVLATVKSSFNTPTGCLLKTNENYHSIHSFSVFNLTCV